MGGWDQNGPYGDWLGWCVRAHARVCMEWIHLTPDRDRWQAVVNVVKNVQVLVPQSQLHSYCM
jgi:hypothetical protein